MLNSKPYDSQIPKSPAGEGLLGVTNQREILADGM